RSGLERITDLGIELPVREDLREVGIREERDDFALERRSVAITRSRLEAVLLIIASQIVNPRREARQDGNRCCGGRLQFVLAAGHAALCTETVEEMDQLTEFDRAADLDSADPSARAVG